MKLIPSRKEGRSWPNYIFGRMRTSTAALLIAFIAIWWLYETYQPQSQPEAPATQIVPPGFIPDPSYTWVPRTDVQRRTQTPTTTTTTTSETPTTTTSATEPTSPGETPSSPTSPTTPTSPTPPTTTTPALPGVPPAPGAPSPSPTPSPAPGQGPMSTPAAPTQ